MNKTPHVRMVPTIMALQLFIFEVMSCFFSDLKLSRRSLLIALESVSNILSRQSAEANTVLGLAKVGYNTGGQSGTRYAETNGWATDQWGNLHFHGEDLIACPNEDNSWTLWLFTGGGDPAGSEACLGLSARTTEVQQPVPCTYTQ